MTSRYVTPVSTDAATGVVADVYGQIADEFGISKPAALLVLSPAPELLAATWSLLRESLLVGDAPRSNKEVVAIGVSVANRCPFCVDAHSMMLHATGDHRLAEQILRGETPEDPEHAQLLAWAGATRTPGAPDLVVPPFPTHHTAEYVGTALAFHLINRMVSALLTDEVLPAGAQRFRAVRSVAGRALARTVRRPLQAGSSLPLLGDVPTDAVPAWANGSPLGTAFAAVRSAARIGGELLSGEAKAAVQNAVAAADGSHPSLGTDWLEGPLADLPQVDLPGARLALLAALAPYCITDAHVADWREVHPDDADLVRLIGFGATAAIEHLEATIGVDEELRYASASDRGTSSPATSPQ
jgi:AhpD family alkylhydroperoxidase